MSSKMYTFKCTHLTHKLDGIISSLYSVLSLSRISLCMPLLKLNCEPYLQINIVFVLIHCITSVSRPFLGLLDRLKCQRTEKKMIEAA